MSENGPHEFDKSNLRQTIIDSPKQFQEGFVLAEGIKAEGNFSRVVFYGEGGSAFPSQLLEIITRDFAARHNGPVVSMIANHGYDLIPESSEGSLNIFASYSGNTEETISALGKAIEAGLPAIAIASGGEVEAIAKEKNIPFVKLPVPNETFQPRMGTGYFVSALAGILENHGFVSGLVAEMKSSIDSIGKDFDAVEKSGMELAAKISGKTPVIYSNEKYSRLAMVWKIKFNEHAKNPAYWNFFPELNHNEMIGYTNHADRYFLIMLRDGDDDPRNLKRYKVMADIVSEKGLDTETLDLVGENAFVRIFNSLMLADFTAYYLAMNNKIDPTPVDMVEEFKRRLKA